MASQENVLLAMTGSAIFTVGILSICAHFASALSRERILLWFGLFASPYGLALIYRSIVLPEWDDRAGLLFTIVGRLIGLLATIPALLLFREFYGVGWRLSTKWLIWIYALSLLALLGLVITDKRSESIPSPGIAMVILVPLSLLIGRLAGYRPPPITGRRVIFVGLSVFFLTFSTDHLLHWKTEDARVTTEPFGFLALTICLGYVVSRRVAANEVEWLSMTDEMRAARKIQAAILPSSMPVVSGYSVAARYAPMTAVAGDFFSFPKASPGCIEIILADVMGHGVGAALIASMVKVSVVAGAEAHEQPAEIIRDLNTTLCREAPSQLATAVYVSMNREAGVGKYSAAGQPPPLLWRRGPQRIDALDVAGLLLGIRPEESFSCGEFHFEPGDRLLIYSDGLTEAENKFGLSFGDMKLSDLLAGNQTVPTEQFAALLLDEVLKWTADGSGHGQEDDITFVVVDID